MGHTEGTEGFPSVNRLWQAATEGFAPPSAGPYGSVTLRVTQWGGAPSDLIYFYKNKYFESARKLNYGPVMKPW